AFHTEIPQRRVRIRSFAAGRFEVTRAEWEAFVDATSRKTPEWMWMESACDWHNTRSNRHTIECVRRQDAQASVGWLSKTTAQHDRLLTEAEWEYAARAGTTGPFWFGAPPTPEQANFFVRGRNNGSTPVGSFPPNPFGLYDTAGNLAEWT